MVTWSRTYHALRRFCAPCRPWRTAAWSPPRGLGWELNWTWQPCSAIAWVRAGPNLFDLPGVVDGGPHEPPTDHGGGIEEPHADLARQGMAPHQVGPAIPVDIAHANKLPGAVDGRPHGPPTNHGGAIEQPHTDLARWDMAPHQVSPAIPVDIAHADNLPGAVDGGPHGPPTDHGGAIEQ